MGATRQGPARARIASLRSALEQLVADFQKATHVDDPVRLLQRYGNPADREIAAFVAAGLAFGRVRSVINSVEAMLEAMGPRPAQFVRAFSPQAHARRLEPLVHRWTRGEDLVALVLVLQQMLRSSGSLEGFLAEGLAPAAPDVTDALESFVSRACAIDVSAAYGVRAPRPGVAYFFPRPGAGSACKRLNLFLRWMVRRDDIDPGGWTAVSPAQLIVPLDVHVIRVGQCLGLTRYRSPGWRMAADITASLRMLDPTDPVRYDFALCHLGMLGSCGYGRPQRDTRCPLQGLCRPGRARRQSLRSASSQV